MSPLHDKSLIYRIIVPYVTAPFNERSANFRMIIILNLLIVRIYSGVHYIKTSILILYRLRPLFGPIGYL